MGSPKQEAEFLVDAALPIATQALRQSGEFAPYGAVLRTDASVVLIEIEDPAESSPTAGPIDRLRQRLRERVERHEAIAAAIVFAVRVRAPAIEHESDAIEVLVEHRDSYCAEMFLPFRVKAGALTLGQMFVQPCGMHILS